MLQNNRVTANNMNGVDIIFKAAETGTLGNLQELMEEVILQKGNKFYELRLRAQNQFNLIKHL